MTTYLEKFKDPRWQKKRLEVFERDEFTCQVCMDTDTTLNVHHRYYNSGTDPWDYPIEAFATVCEDCHKDEKDNWLAEMKSLSRSLKRHFFSTELDCLRSVFDRVEFLHFPYVVMDAVEVLLLDETKQRKLIDDYYAHLKSLGEG